MERINLKKLNDVASEENCHLKVSNGSTALEDLDAVVEINSSWETIRREHKNFSQRGSKLL
jgi:hypothetical protein